MRRARRLDLQNSCSFEIGTLRDAGFARHRPCALRALMDSTVAILHRHQPAMPGRDSRATPRKIARSAKNRANVAGVPDRGFGGFVREAMRKCCIASWRGAARPSLASLLIALAMNVTIAAAIAHKYRFLMVQDLDTHDS